MSTNLEQHTIKVPKALIMAGVNAYLTGMQIHIDNWGAWNGTDWHHDNSFVLLPSGQKRPFPLPKSDTITGVARRWNAYLNDVASQSVTVTADGAKPKLQVLFESAGQEIKVGCINRASDKPCVAHLLKHSGQLDHAQVAAWLTPKVVDGRIAFTDPEVEVDFDFSFDSFILESLHGIVNWFAKPDNIMKRQVRRSLAAALKEREIATGLAHSINNAVAEQLVERLHATLGDQSSKFIAQHLKIVDITDGGTNYLLTVAYPAPVVAGSLKITNFAVDQPRASITCPGKVSFHATIHTDHAMSGQAWLENEDGHPSPPLPWHTNKAESATSTIARTWNPPDRHTTTGWSKLAVSFVDVFGTTHIIRSAASRFHRQCSRPIVHASPADAGLASQPGRA